MRAFVIAMECEAECVRPHLRDGDRLYVSGIGKVNAAAATQKAIDDGAAEIFNAGVAGGFGEGIAAGDVFEIGRAVEYDFDLSLVNGTGVGVHDERKTPYFQLATYGLFPAKSLGTGDRFRDDTADFPLLRSLGVEVRDMEGAAIAHVAERNGVPCMSVKCITNVVGGGAVDQYRVNMDMALARLSAALGEVLNR
ncbi:MAG: 5'-methylthioadenosine/S-adenosylhomocysteine nucleosidase [Kiritimatiellae bacterium]|nr:5'-methylthioadenosine/S-adenosylhomocysteine nucleosidase [Kiritimatiellia bacterium]